MPGKRIFSYHFIIMACLLTVQVAKAGDSSFHKTSDGILVYPSLEGSGNPRQVQLKVISAEIIRVIASPENKIEPAPSLMRVEMPAQQVSWNIAQSNTSTVTLATSSISATVDLTTGAVSFADASGNLILQERKYGGLHFEPSVSDGSPSFKIRQTFETSGGDAYYGLGQHQDDIFNYKGQQVRLFQNNTEVAVPFLISRMNYGLLWDNNSLTYVGDVRPYRPLSALRLFSKEGDRGWLTASYSNDRKKPEQVDLVKAESVINYEWLGDTRRHLPREFKPSTGLVRWEGSIASEMTGVHKLRFTYAGYVKVWINGYLMLDRWRQAWNPGSAVLNIQMDSAKKIPIKIEWMPDGGESYLSLKSLEPIPVADQNSYSFLSESGKLLDYYFIHGNNLDEVIAGYRELTGKATMVPRWAMGFWQSRERYKTQEEILNTMAEFRKRKIPIDNIVLDWNYWKQDQWGSQEFDESRFPNPDSMIKVLHEKYKARFMISVWPKFYEGISAYKNFDEKGWLYKRNIANRQRDWIAQGYVSTFYDAFNRGARNGFWNLINEKLFKKGIDAWWMDASEPDILSNVDPEVRKDLMTPTALGAAAQWLNAYPLENARGIYEGQRSTSPGQRVFLLTRSGFAGSQRYAAAIWSGDIASRWTDMKSQISAGINFSMSGIPYWTMDIGGFAVERRFENAQGKDLEEWREQMTRWYQFGAFCPLFRVHGQYPYREIFNTAPDNHPAYQSMLFYDKLRYRLMPYIYTLAGMTNQNDYTIMRGLVMDFPQDAAVNNIGDQYMFGPSILVNPVYQFEAYNRNLYLPSGQGWYDFYSGRYEQGGRHILADAPYERMPVFIREGSIIPFGPELQYSAEKPADPITLFIYTGKDASFSLYEDENTNYNYEKGAFSRIPVSYHESEHELIIGKREGSFKGMLKKRQFRIVWITKGKPAELNPDQKADAEIKYRGNSEVIRMKE